MVHIFASDSQILERLEKIDSYITKLLTENLHPDLYFHNAALTLDSEKGVVAVADTLARIEGITEKDKELLLAAAYFQHTGFIYKREDNKNISTNIAKDILYLYRYKYPEIREIISLILSTNSISPPKSHLEKILKDANLDYLGRYDFFDKNDALRRELEVQNREIWYRQTLNFLAQHTYYTNASNILREKQKQENIKKLKSLI